MSTPESNVVQMTAAPKRKPGQRWTDKRIDALKVEQFNAGYLSGHADGWIACQNTIQKHNPLVEFFAGVAITAIAWGLDRWVF